MDLESAIKHAEEVAQENYGKATEYQYQCNELSKCLKCGDEHMQLAEWLRDYKRLLEQEPSVSENPNNCDLISRKALISHIENQSREWGEDYDAQQILGDIEDMPSVKPQESCEGCDYKEWLKGEVKPQTGHWIVHKHAEEFYGRVVDNYECNNCGDWYLNKTNFCPNCGCNMSENPTGSDVVEPQESEDKE